VETQSGLVLHDTQVLPLRDKLTEIDVGSPGLRRQQSDTAPRGIIELSPSSKPRQDIGKAEPDGDWTRDVV